MSNFVAYLKTKSFRNTILFAIGSVIVVVLIAFYSLGYYTRHGSGIPVPKITGINIDRALSTLKEQGFGVSIDSVYVLDQAPGTVIEQDPDAGTNVKEGRVIYLKIVKNQAPNVALPDILDAPYISAEATLSNYGLKIGDTTYKSDIARDHVLEIKFAGQQIQPGTKIPKGSKVDLVLGDGSGASEVEIPDLINQDLDAARFVLKQSGVVLGTITYQGTITDSTNLIIVAQSPAKTDSVTKVSNGTRINVTVTQGKKTP
ncbi:PASTA domain-containing protein [Mucilaginibacter sp. McL0603]|uniref:PASTA domain-containing protein n=1 Tax=Mucilaginibacter sp. McL0603 TaxID=3415670 RepID=UPI003CF46A6B